MYVQKNWRSTQKKPDEISSRFPPGPSLVTSDAFRYPDLKTWFHCQTCIFTPKNCSLVDSPRNDRDTFPSGVNLLPAFPQKLPKFNCGSDSEESDPFNDRL
jgi:hypothetical protein